MFPYKFFTLIIIAYLKFELCFFFLYFTRPFQILGAKTLDSLFIRIRFWCESINFCFLTNITFWIWIRTNEQTNENLKHKITNNNDWRKIKNFNPGIGKRNFHFQLIECKTKNNNTTTYKHTRARINTHSQTNYIIITHCKYTFGVLKCS